MFEYTLDCHEDNLYVEPETPVLDVPDVAADALFHLPEFLGFSTIARYLSPSCYARLGEVPYHIFTYQFRVDVSVVEHVRPRTYNTHITFKYIEELWKLINVCLAHEVAELELSRVVLRCLLSIGVFVDMHRTKLYTFESLAVESSALLLEVYGPRTLNLNYQCNDRNERQHAKAYYRTEHNVERALNEFVGRIKQWLDIVRQNIHITKALRLQLKPIVTELTWNIEEVNDIPVTEPHDLYDLLVFIVRQ